MCRSGDSTESSKYSSQVGTLCTLELRGENFSVDPHARLTGAHPCRVRALVRDNTPDAYLQHPRNPRHFDIFEGGRKVLALPWGAVVSWLAFSFSAVAGFLLVLCLGHID